MSIQPIRCGLPFCNSSLEEERSSSITGRVLMVALGTLALIAGILSLYEVPGFVSLGTTGAWTLIATGECLALIAISLKCVKTEGVQRSFTEGSFLDRVDSLPNRIPSEEIIPTDAPIFIPPSGNACPLQETLSLEMFIYIASFLGPREIVNATTVSTHFLSVMRSEYLWSEYLGHPDFRIWGATRWNLKRGDDDGYQFQRDDEYVLEQENGLILGEPFHQLRAHHELKKTEWGQIRSFDYFMRLMPGGPLAFQAIPVLNFADAKNLLPTDLDGPLIYGKDLWGHCFFAIRVIDRIQHTDPAILVFIHANQWEQEPNVYWEKNQLSLDDTHVLNYILALMRKDNLAQREEFSSPLFLKTLEMV